MDAAKEEISAVSCGGGEACGWVGGWVGGWVSVRCARACAHVGMGGRRASLRDEWRLARPSHQPDPDRSARVGLVHRVAARPHRGNSAARGRRVLKQLHSSSIIVI